MRQQFRRHLALLRCSHKMRSSIVVISLGFILVFVLWSDSCLAAHYSNYSRNFNYLPHNFESLKRQSRFLTFQTLDDDLKIALEFIVPFISIPVKRTADATTGASKGIANINLAALVLTGVTVLAGVSTASFLSNMAKMVSPKTKTTRMADAFSDLSSLSLGYRSSNGDKSEAPISDIVSSIEAIFREYDIDITACVQKVICSSVQYSTENVSHGKGTSVNKIIDGLTSNNWMLNLISGTAIREAIDVGRSNYECNYKYRQCKWTDRDIMDFIDSM